MNAGPTNNVYNNCESGYGYRVVNYTAEWETPPNSAMLHQFGVKSQHKSLLSTRRWKTLPVEVCTTVRVEKVTRGWKNPPLAHLFTLQWIKPPSAIRPTCTCNRQIVRCSIVIVFILLHKILLLNSIYLSNLFCYFVPWTSSIMNLTPECFFSLTMRTLLDVDIVERPILDGSSFFRLLCWGSSSSWGHSSTACCCCCWWWWWWCWHSRRRCHRTVSIRTAMFIFAENHTRFTMCLPCSTWIHHKAQLPTMTAWICIILLSFIEGSQNCLILPHTGYVSAVAGPCHIINHL